MRSPAWTPDDRALLLALAKYETTLCPGCGFPKHIAWHKWAAESWKSEQLVCHPCTKREGHQIVYQHTTTSVDQDDVERMPPFEWGVTTTEPDKAAGHQ